MSQMPSPPYVMGCQLFAVIQGACGFLVESQQVEEVSRLVSNLAYVNVKMERRHMHTHTHTLKLRYQGERCYDSAALSTHVK